MNSLLYLTCLIFHCVDWNILMWLINDKINVILPKHQQSCVSFGNLYTSKELECQVIGILLFSFHALYHSIASVLVQLPSFSLMQYHMQFKRFPIVI